MSDEKRLIKIEDVNHIKYIEDPQISPDGQWIAYVQMNANAMQKTYDRNIYLVATTGGPPTQLTRSGKDTNPRWSADSQQLAFVSTRSEKQQVYILPIGKPGEARALTNHENGAYAPAWSPDGTYIAYLSSSNIDERNKEDSAEEPNTPIDELESKHRRERKEEDEKQRWDPRPMERIPYRQGTSFMDDRHAQIYVTRTAEDLDEDEARPRRMTDTATNYSPPQWSKSGRTLVTSRAYDLSADETAFQYQNIYLIDFESGLERRIKDDAYSYFGPIPSYDGDWLIAQRRRDGVVEDLTRLTLLSLEGGDPVDLNLEVDRSITAYDWTPDNQLMVTLATEGLHEIHKLDPHRKAYTPVVKEHISIYDLAVHQDGNIAYVVRSNTQLDELYYKASGGDTVQMTKANTSWMQDIRVLETHEVRYKNKSGDEIQGWYILPPDYEAGKKYPLALNIHGGPHAMWSPSLRAMWHEWQCHAAQGYVVFYCNPRGSDGYGEKFLHALHSAWGNGAREDIMTGVDLMSDKGFVDEARMAITGGSYGGYMTAWIIGHDERFIAAVAQRGVYNLTSFYGTSDIPRLISGAFSTEPWDDAEKLWQHSPLAYAHKIKTPLLIIHSENDFRVPIEQAEQLFAWVRRATDVAVKMLRYPREGHELSRSGEPQHRVSRLREMVNWFNKYCQPQQFEAQPEANAAADAAGDED